LRVLLRLHLHHRVLRAGLHRRDDARGVVVMSLIEQLRPCRCGKCSAWSWAARDVYLRQADALQIIGLRSHAAADIALAITRGGLFSDLGRIEAERWFA
jgi:hypothetical protein